MVLERPNNVIEMDNIMDFKDKFNFELVKSEMTPIDCVKKAAREIQQALNSMEQVVNHTDTSEEVKERISKIISAFSIDKRELVMIIKHYFYKRL